MKLKAMPKDNPLINHNRIIKNDEKNNIIKHKMLKGHYVRTADGTITITLQSLPMMV